MKNVFVVLLQNPQDEEWYLEKVCGSPFQAEEIAEELMLAGKSASYEMMEVCDDFPLSHLSADEDIFLPKGK